MIFTIAEEVKKATCCSTPVSTVFARRRKGGWVAIVMLSVQQRFIFGRPSEAGLHGRGSASGFGSRSNSAGMISLFPKRMDAVLRQLRYGSGDFRMEGAIWVRSPDHPRQHAAVGGHRRDAG